MVTIKFLVFIDFSAKSINFMRILAIEDLLSVSFVHYLLSRESEEWKNCTKKETIKRAKDFLNLNGRTWRKLEVSFCYLLNKSDTTHHFYNWITLTFKLSIRIPHWMLSNSIILYDNGILYFLENRKGCH